MEEKDELLAVLSHQAKMQEQILTAVQEKEAVRTAAHAEAAEREIDLIDVAFTLLNKWWVILLVTAAFTFATMAYCMATYVPTYRATAKMFVNNNSFSIGSTQVSVTTGDLTASKELVDTYCEIMKTYLVLDQVGHELEKQGYPGYSYENLIGKLSCGSVNSTEIFSITIVDTDGERAIDIVNTIVDVLPDQISTVIEGSSAHAVDLAKVANLNNSGITKKVIIGGILGFLLSCAAVFLVNYLFNDSITEAAWLHSTYSSIPILGEVPDANHPEGRGYYHYYKHHTKSSKKEDSSK